MTYSSLIFIYLFLPVVLLIYYLMPQKFHRYTLLALSMIFSMSFGLGCLVFVAAYTLISYAAGRICGALRRRRIISLIVLITAAAADIFILLFFRRDILADISGTSGIMKLVVPAGISFLTLASIGYIIDVWKETVPAEKNLVDFSLYMMFFPKLLMGPYISFRAFKRSLRSPFHGLSETGLGLAVFVKGLAKKVILADNIYLLFSAVKNTPPEELTSLSALLGVISFFFCMYFTLSGFSDMGAGLGRCFGIRLPKSFSCPAVSTDITSLSEKWHIPATGWFRKHIASPAVSMTSNKFVCCTAIVIASILFSLWYRFSINMLIWGIAAGAVLACEKLFLAEKLTKPTRVMYTYIMMSFGMVFFFSESMTYTLKYFASMLSISSGLADAGSIYLLRMYAPLLLICLIVSADIPGRFIERTWKKRLKRILDAISPVLIAGLLALCTIEMSYTGVSEMMLPVLREVSR